MRRKESAAQSPIAGIRVYDQWAGNPKGTPENPAKCIAEVPSAIARGMVYRQCEYPRGHGPDGLYCRKHGRRAAARQAGSV